TTEHLRQRKFATQTIHIEPVKAIDIRALTEIWTATEIKAGRRLVHVVVEHLSVSHRRLRLKAISKEQHAMSSDPSN
ncbi:hypothetical protein P9373_26160, partial [Escherichia coli]|uniref:hypothetical protein n=1 Tax=Escherichia coli TaxID=562 RepID=UPI0038928F38